MAYIYQIQNIINNKLYIGKTLYTIEKRWKEHLKDSDSYRCKDRPLYRAFHKYGIDNFKITILEEVSSENVDEREKYWIEVLGTYKYGYNATLGGDGKAYADYDLIFDLWDLGKNNKEICKITGYDTATVKIALFNRGVSSEERKKRGYKAIIHPVAMLDKETEDIINIFPSVKQAYHFLNKPANGHIAAVCNGRRKTAYGYKWKYINRVSPLGPVKQRGVLEI